MERQQQQEEEEEEGEEDSTFFLTEENNFGVHSMSESHLSSSRSISRSPPLPPSATTTSSVSIDAEIIEKLDDDNVQNSNELEADNTIYNDSSKKTTDKSSESATTGTTMSAIPSHVYERGGHSHTPSIGSTISTPSSPQHNLSSSAISDDSELDIASHNEEETGGPADSTSSSFPQLVMPRVNMPRRKAFTEIGRTMGKLKIMVVGDSGIYSSAF